jgi:hypothetical protein
MAGKRRTNICGLCGEDAEVSREHFVPRCLWAGPLPNRVETVPACGMCNAGSNLDDEYFRNTLILMFDQTHPQKQELLAGPVMRSFHKHPGWAKDTLAKMKVQPMFSPSGLWVGDWPVLPLDRDRFSRSLLKIVKGLFFKIRKQPFPKSGQVGIVGQLTGETKPLLDMIEDHLFPPTFSFGDDVFEWWFCQTRDGITMWKMAFYRSVVFYAWGIQSAEDGEPWWHESAPPNDARPFGTGKPLPTDSEARHLSLPIPQHSKTLHSDQLPPDENSKRPCRVFFDASFYLKNPLPPGRLDRQFQFLDCVPGFVVNSPLNIARLVALPG